MRAISLNVHFHQSSPGESAPPTVDRRPSGPKAESSTPLEVGDVGRASRSKGRCIPMEALIPNVPERFVGWWRVRFKLNRIDTAVGGI